MLGLGVLAIMRGLKGKDSLIQAPEELRAVWEAYHQLENIEANTFKMLELLNKIMGILQHNYDSNRNVHDIQHANKDILASIRDILFNRTQR